MVGPSNRMTTPASGIVVSAWGGCRPIAARGCPELIVGDSRLELRLAPRGPSMRMRKVGWDGKKRVLGDRIYRSRCAYVCLSLLAFLCVGCGKKEVPTPPISRLDKPEVQKWLDTAFATGNRIRFFSSNGARMCCEYPNISIEFLPEERVVVAVDGWEPKQYTASYAVRDDGEITVIPGSAYPLPRLQGDEVTNVYVVRKGSTTFLLESTKPPPDGPVTRSLWPLIFIKNGEWLPAPSSKPPRLPGS
jgi:hypothetical protein